MCKLRTNRHISEINRGKSLSGSKLIMNLTMYQLHQLLQSIDNNWRHFSSYRSIPVIPKTNAYGIKQFIAWWSKKYSKSESSIAEAAYQIALRRRWAKRSRIRCHRLRRDTVLRKAGPHFFAVDHHFRFFVCGLLIMLSSARMHSIENIFLWKHLSICIHRCFV